MLSLKVWDYLRRDTGIKKEAWFGLNFCSRLLRTHVAHVSSEWEEWLRTLSAGGGRHAAVRSLFLWGQGCGVTAQASFGTQVPKCLFSRPSHSGHTLPEKPWRWPRAVPGCILGPMEAPFVSHLCLSSSHLFSQLCPYGTTSAKTQSNGNMPPTPVNIQASKCKTGSSFFKCRIWK